MLQAFVEKILSLAPVQTFEIDGRMYADKVVRKIKTPDIEGLPNLSTLGALADYVSHDPDRLVEKYPEIFPLIINIHSESLVTLSTAVHGPERERFRLLSVSPVLPTIQFGKPMNHEEFIITLQSKFVRDLQVEALLTLVSSIKAVNEQNITDNGVSQTATVRQGVQVLDSVIVPNPVELSPFRTFIEVEQPSSEFIFRLNDRAEPALYEADGGAWKIEASQNIEDYLISRLGEAIEMGKVVILR